MGISSDLFYKSGSEDDTLYLRVAPSQDQLAYLQENWKPLAEYLKGTVSAHFGIPCNTWIQGSYKFGTLIRPVSRELEYDVDLGFYLTPKPEQQSKSPNAASYRAYLKNLLEIYASSDEEVNKIASPSKEKCERLHYRKKFHIDVPAYKLINGEHMLALLPNNWEESDPQKLYLWFRQVCDTSRDGQQLRRFIQYLKNWAAQKFIDKDKDFQPSSIMLSVLVANAYIILNSEITSDDDNGFTLIINKVLSKLNTSSTIPNPADGSEDLNRLSEEGVQNFIDELTELKSIAVAAGKTNSKFQSSLIWSRAFGHFFPIAAEDYEAEGVPSRIAPEIEIDRMDKENFTVKNTIMSVPKNTSLRFRITNPESFPWGCTVEWVARNAGKEAMNVNDMGHKTSGQGMFEHTENTAYHGTHYMDCSIYDLHGNLYSFRRVPVSILRQTKEQIRQKTRPTYHRIGKT